LCASFGSLTQVTPGVGAPPGDSNAPQLKYFTLDYKDYSQYTNKSESELDPEQISDKIFKIDSAVDNSSLKEEEKKRCGQILRAIFILDLESYTSNEIIDYFKAYLGSNILRSYFKSFLNIKSVEYFDLVESLVEILAHWEFGEEHFLEKQREYFPTPLSWILCNLYVKRLICEKIRDDASFFPLILKNLLQYSDGSEIITAPQFTLALNDLIENWNKEIETWNKNYPQPTDPDLKTKVETRAQSLFDLLKASLAEHGETSLTTVSTKESKPEENADKSPELKDAEKAALEAELATLKAKEEAEKTALEAEEEKKRLATLKAKEETEKAALEDEEEKKRLATLKANPQNDGNMEKIFIPVSVVGIIFLIAGILAYYFFIFKRKQTISIPSL
jgi:hypothetical protein